MPASRKGWCIHCRGDIETLTARPHQLLPCPHCGREVSASAAVAYRKRLQPDRGWFWLVINLVLTSILGVLAYYFFWRQIKSGFYLLADEVGGATAAAACLGLALFVLLCLISWMLLPLFLYFGLRDLRRRTTDLEETTRLCARHLARLVGDRASGSKGEKLSE